MPWFKHWCYLLHFLVLGRTVAAFKQQLSDVLFFFFLPQICEDTLDQPLKVNRTSVYLLLVRHQTFYLFQNIADYANTAGVVAYLNDVNEREEVTSFFSAFSFVLLPLSVSAVLICKVHLSPLVQQMSALQLGPGQVWSVPQCCSQQHPSQLQLTTGVPERLVHISTVWQ